MPQGDKSADTYDKVAETFKRKGDKEWAQAVDDEDDDDGYHYENARKNYGTADKARQRAEELRDE